MPELPFHMPELPFQMPVLPFQMPELPFHMLDRLSTGLENPGKSLDWKKIPGLEVVEVLESPGIKFFNLQLCQHYDFD